MKKFILVFVLLGTLPFFGVSIADQEAGVGREGISRFTLSSYLYGGGRGVSLEIFADGVTPAGARDAFLSGSLDVNSGFGFTSESVYFSKLRLPDGALQVRPDGRKILLNLDLADIEEFRASRRINGGALSETTDPSVFAFPSIRFTWDIGDTVPDYGGKISSFYQRPDGEWARSVITNVKREASGEGDAFGFRSSAAVIKNFEYAEEGSERSASSDSILFPSVSFSFPSDPALPPEP